MSALDDGGPWLNVKENPPRALALLCGLPKVASRNNRRGRRLVGTKEQKKVIAEGRRKKRGE